MTPEPCLIFVHIPKTAGTSFNAMLAELFSPRNFKVGLWGEVKRTLAELLALSDQQRAELRCVHGHIPYGVHSVLPGAHRYISFFRHPEQRVTSLYRHRLRKGQIPAGTRLGAFAASDEFEVENGMTKRLAGRFAGPNRGLPLHVPSYMSGAQATGPCSGAEFDLACARLHLPEFMVGVQERFDESLLWLHHQLGWPAPIGVGAQNCDPNPVTPWTEEDLAIVRERNAYDLALYAEVQRKFEAQVAAAGPSFQADLGAVQAIMAVLEDPSVSKAPEGALGALTDLVDSTLQGGTPSEGEAILRLLANRLGGIFLELYRAHTRAAPC